MKAMVAPIKPIVKFISTLIASLKRKETCVAKWVGRRVDRGCMRPCQSTISWGQMEFKESSGGRWKLQTVRC